MKISELLRGLADLIDQESGPTMSVTVNEPVPDAQEQTPDDIARMKLLAGMISDEPRDYANEPQEMIGTVDNVTHDGTDVNKSKDPADIRTNAPSMYPAAQWRGN